MTLKKGDRVAPTHVGETHDGRILDWTRYRGEVLADPYTLGRQEYVPIRWEGDGRQSMPDTYPTTLLRKVRS